MPVDLLTVGVVATSLKQDEHRLAIHPAQVPVINAAFTPSEDEIAEARAIVAAFAESPEAGTLQIDRRMIDRPHLRLAQRLLGIALLAAGTVLIVRD